MKRRHILIAKRYSDNKFFMKISDNNQDMVSRSQIITGDYNDRRQLEQQKKLMEMQSQYDEIASQRNLNNQLELWQKTNYPAQVEQMQKAGLSVGLMYKGGGQSGQIAADNTNRQAPTAANGGGMEIQQMMQLMLNNKMTEAQIENIKADKTGLA